jgi:hypothetical protein
MKQMAICWKCSESKWKAVKPGNRVVSMEEYQGCKLNPKVTFENKDEECPLIKQKKGSNKP